MDEAKKKEFKWKFYHLTVEINIIVLLVAMSIPVYMIIHSPLTVPVIVFMLIAALVLAVDFVKRYRKTRAWLDMNAGEEKETDTMRGPAGTGDHDPEDEG